MFHYKICCVDAPNGKVINDMVDIAKQIKINTFFRHVSRKEVSELLGYDKYLKISQDYCVSFWKSKFMGEPCYYVEHSRIEYIYTESRVTQLRSEGLSNSILIVKGAFPLGL